MGRRGQPKNRSRPSRIDDAGQGHIRLVAPTGLRRRLLLESLCLIQAAAPTHKHDDAHPKDCLGWARIL